MPPTHMDEELRAAREIRRAGELFVCAERRPLYHRVNMSAECRRDVGRSADGTSGRREHFEIERLRRCGHA